MRMRQQIYVMAMLCMALSGSVSAHGHNENNEHIEHEKHQMGYPEQYDITSSGASSFEGMCDDEQSKYFVINDYYNMESAGSLHILSNFETYQQTTEYTCGSACGHMVLNWFDKELAKQYDELAIAEMSGADSHKGTSPTDLGAFFEELGWKTEVSASPDGYFESIEQFEEFVIDKIDAGVPIMVDWTDWGGHWQVIVGIDTCKGETCFDDVLIFADPYDVTDQWQDGYYTFGALRFLDMWTEGRCTGKSPEDIFVHPFVIAEP